MAAGCRFFAGYPITPSSEVAERMSRLLPPLDGVFVQMEDEIASMAAVIGASMGGVKAMTATSGPGFSLKLENLGYAAAAEIPCVIVDVMRGGPSTGMPTRPAQADLMQTRWGSHGDYPIIVLAPASVREVHDETVRAFALSESLRTPVVVLYDQAVAQLTETIELPAPRRDRAGHAATGRTARPSGYQPYAAGDDLVPPMARPGDGYRTHTTGLTHAESGFPTQAPEVVERNQARLLSKLGKNRARIESFDAQHTADADVLVVAIGISARAAQRAVTAARARGIRAGLFRPITLWPFPEDALRAAAAASARAVLVPEMNAGQLVLEVERVLRSQRVTGLNRYDGEPIAPAQIEARVEQLAREAVARRPPARTPPRGRREAPRGDMIFDTAADFDVRRYLRPDRMPHHLCPGCGHGIALRALLWAIDDAGIGKDELAVVSGIGCAGRLSAYIDAHTFHVTHGRPLAFATGLALARPDLHVVVITGDGDCLAIGGNHLIHACRRNLKLTCLMLNNEIYGMTGGQVSPTTSESMLTTTTPLGNAEPAFDACALAAAAGAGFVGREVTHHLPKLKELVLPGAAPSGLRVRRGAVRLHRDLRPQERTRLVVRDDPAAEERDPSERLPRHGGHAVPLDRTGHRRAVDQPAAGIRSRLPRRLRPRPKKPSGKGGGQ